MGDTWDPRAELAGREGLALLFLAEEGRVTTRFPELSWWVRRGWPYYLLQRKVGPQRVLVNKGVLVIKGALVNKKGLG